MFLFRKSIWLQASRTVLVVLIAYGLSQLLILAVDRLIVDEALTRADGSIVFLMLAIPAIYLERPFFNRFPKLLGSPRIAGIVAGLVYLVAAVLQVFSRPNDDYPWLAPVPWILALLSLLVSIFCFLPERTRTR